MGKTTRLEMILRIIREETIRNQQELQLSLRKKGLEVTQATLSRDIKQLGIVKSPDKEGGYIYTTSETTVEQTSKQAVAKERLLIEFSGQMAVIKTRPGYAMAIASDIDEKGTKEIIGTIAGDDTILVIPREGYSRQALTAALNRLTKEK